MSKESAATGATIATTVDVVEPLGSEQIIYLTTGPHTLVAVLDMQTELVLDDLKVAVDTSKMHLFKSDTEIAII